MGQRQDALKSNEKMICIERLLLRTIYCTSCSSYKKLKECPFFLTWRDPVTWVYFGNCDKQKVAQAVVCICLNSQLFWLPTIIIFNIISLQVEALAVKLTQNEGELIQEKFEVKKLANFLKQVI